MPRADDELETGAQLRQTGAGLVHFVEDNPLAAVVGALIVGLILARCAFLRHRNTE